MRNWMGLLFISTPLFAAQLAPPPASVLFSTRWERPEARAVAAEFGTTHFTWFYPKSRDYLRGLLADGFAVGTALNANQSVTEEGFARDLEGKPLVAPWMQSWGAKWISISSPATRQALFTAAQRHIEWGATSIQFDDPALATASFGWGGDFSAAAVQRFGHWLAKSGADQFPELPEETRSGQFNYPAWLAKQGITTNAAYLAKRSKLALNSAWERFHLEEVRGFFGELRSQLHGAARPVALTMNLTNPRPDARTFNLIDLADGIISETSSSDLANTALGVATAQGAGVAYYPSLQPEKLAATRRQIAAFYALGAWPLVPWDIYMPDKIAADKTRSPQPRYFGTPAQYGDLYRLVRQQPTLFNDMESPASVLLMVQVEQFKAAEVLPIIRQLQAQQIPFSIMVAKSTYPARAFDAKRIANARAVIWASRFSDLDTASRAALDESEAKRIQTDAIIEHADRLAPVQTKSNAPLWVIPRRNTQKPGEWVIHLVRTEEGEKQPVALTINPAWLGQGVRAVEIFTPAKPKAEKRVYQDGQVVVTMDGDWAVVRLLLGK